MLMKKLIYALVALLIAGGAYWVGFEHCSKKELVIEVVEETPKCEDFDNCEDCPNALDEVLIDSLNVEVTNVTE